MHADENELSAFIRVHPRSSAVPSDLFLIRAAHKKRKLPPWLGSFLFCFEA